MGQCIYTVFPGQGGMLALEDEVCKSLFKTELFVHVPHIPQARGYELSHTARPILIPGLSSSSLLCNYTLSKYTAYVRKKVYFLF